MLEESSDAATKADTENRNYHSDGTRVSDNKIQVGLLQPFFVLSTVWQRSNGKVIIILA